MVHSVFKRGQLPGTEALDARNIKRERVCAGQSQVEDEVIGGVLRDPWEDRHVGSAGDLDHVGRLSAQKLNDGIFVANCTEKYNWDKDEDFLKIFLFTALWNGRVGPCDRHQEGES